MTTYGETVEVRDYISQLEIHQYIPQSDALIQREITDLASTKSIKRVLDVGMGPGRLSHRIAGIPGVRYVGLDESEIFVEYARLTGPHNAEFMFKDFLRSKPRIKYDVIMLQGVWHHVPLPKRSAWFNQFDRALSQKGTLLISDEFVAPYRCEYERALNASLFYLHIIGEAVKANSEGLVRDEAINLLSDALYGLSLERGYYDERLLQHIRNESIITNNLLQSGNFCRARKRASRLVKFLHVETVKLAVSGGYRIDRGDYKISIDSLCTNFADSGWQLEKKLLIGPVEWLGGMGVLLFRRK